MCRPRYVNQNISGWDRAISLPNNPSFHGTALFAWLTQTECCYDLARDGKNHVIKDNAFALMFIIIIPSKVCAPLELSCPSSIDGGFSGLDSSWDGGSSSSVLFISENQINSTHSIVYHFNLFKWNRTIDQNLSSNWACSCLMVKELVENVRTCSVMKVQIRK